MAKAFINDENLTDIADAIRATLDESRQYLPSEMAAAIDSIPIMAQLNRKKYFQSVPAGAASGYATIEQIEGNSVVWNQLVDTSSTSVVVQSGHIYYAKINGTASIATSDGTPISVTGGTDIIHDLTAMFKAGNEPTTVEEFEAWMAQNIGTLPYYDYNTGELLSCKMSGVKSIGFNWFDTNTLEVGKYRDINNTESVNAGRMRSDVYFEVQPNQQYFAYNDEVSSAYGVVICWYDSNKVFLYGEAAGTRIVTSPNDACYMRISSAANVGDICINISDPNKNGTYEPYQSDSADIDVTTITGLNTSTNVRETIFSNGMKQADYAGTIKDLLALLRDTATVRVGSRAYQSGDESDPDVLTDGTTTYYALTTPIEYTDLQDANGNPLNPRYKVEQGGTEQVLPVNTSTPTTVAPTLTTTYTKDNN